MHSNIKRFNFGVIDKKIGVKNRYSLYAARLYKGSKPLHTKNAFLRPQTTKKNGRRNGAQRYNYNRCGQCFSGGQKPNPSINTFLQRNS